jgi:hypothetical protein
MIKREEESTNIEFEYYSVEDLFDVVTAQQQFVGDKSSYVTPARLLKQPQI